MVAKVFHVTFYAGIVTESIMRIFDGVEHLLNLINAILTVVFLVHGCVDPVEPSTDRLSWIQSFLRHCVELTRIFHGIFSVE